MVVVAVATGREKFPALSIEASVVEALLVSSNIFTPAVVFAPHTLNLLYGVVVPMPTLPPEVITILPVPPPDNKWRLFSARNTNESAKVGP